ncbi:glycoprotein 3-alpha-L-fucosyltransferase A-like [Haliotis cracherodii]|uniref:glycoprotein 3-alpha-L-fucosyltransferase A-like n=1 Tax=Haliotis cracherodii TaxID=6455 RepID=UPI0039ED1EBE
MPVWDGLLDNMAKLSLVFPRWRRLRLCICVAILSVIGFLVSMSSKPKDDPCTNRDCPIREFGDTGKTILWYFVPRYVLDSPERVPLRRCPELGCYVTTNRRYLPHAHAVLLSAQQILGNSQPVRYRDQVWVYHNNEPMYLFYENLIEEFRRPQWRSAFNWTMDFRHDSDLQRPYSQLRTRSSTVNRDYSTIVQKKTKLVAWAVSNCIDVSGRLSYAHELQKYIPVDIYGRCGSGAFSRSTPEEWNDYLNSTYKFYLSFESSFCKDYISEKFFNNFNLDLVTVARGGGNYTRDVPRGTYINTADFKSPKELADHLLYLHNNHDKYIEILKRKQRYFYTTEAYYFTTQTDILHPFSERYVEHYYEEKPMCQLCSRLHNLSGYSKTIPDIVPWIKLGKCSSSGDLPVTYFLYVLSFVLTLTVMTGIR